MHDIRSWLQTVWIWLCAAIHVFGVFWAEPALAQSFPLKPLRMIVPFAAAGPPDILGRVVSQKLAEGLGQPVIVENRVGAGGTIGSEAVAKAAPDGYTLLFASIASLGISPALYPNVAYDPVKSFAPISLVGTTSFVMFVQPSMQAKTLREFIALAKSKPGQLNYGASTSGTPPHLMMEMFKSQAGVDIVGINYNASAAAITALLAGHVQVVVDQFAAALPLIAAGKVRPLVVTSEKRVKQLPDVPAAPEAGLPGFTAVSWFGVVAPRATPNDIVKRLNAELVKAIGTKDLGDRLMKFGLEPTPSTPEQFAAIIKSDVPKWAAAVKASGAKVQ
jgi:tripartite-type tricarboxylate transporter receptor subunit TctC